MPKRRTDDENCVLVSEFWGSLTRIQRVVLHLTYDLANYGRWMEPTEDLLREDTVKNARDWTKEDIEDCRIGFIRRVGNFLQGNPGATFEHVLSSLFDKDKDL